MTEKVISAGGGPVSARRPDTTELRARVEDAIRNGGDYVVRAITEGLDLGERARVVAITITLLRLDDRSMARGRALCAELRELMNDGSVWPIQQTLDELEAVLTRAVL